MLQMLKQMASGGGGSPGAVPPNPFAQFGGMPTGSPTPGSPTMYPGASASSVRFSKKFAMRYKASVFFSLALPSHESVRTLWLLISLPSR